MFVVFSRQAFRFLFYFTADGVKCGVAAVKRLLLLFIFFGITESILVILKIKYH